MELDISSQILKCVKKNPLCKTSDMILLAEFYRDKYNLSPEAAFSVFVNKVNSKEIVSPKSIFRARQKLYKLSFGSEAKKVARQALLKTINLKRKAKKN